MRSFARLVQDFAYLEELVWLLLGRSGGIVPTDTFGPWSADHTTSATIPADQIMVAVDPTTPLTLTFQLDPQEGAIHIVKGVVASATPYTLAANTSDTIEDIQQPGTFGATTSIQGEGGAVGFKYRLSDRKWISFIGFPSPV